jgi:putative tryptophan/tyrosine transport system substrate-binding protein
VTRVAFPLPRRASSGGYAPAVVASARTLGISLFTVAFDAPDQIEKAIEEAVAKGANALLIRDHSMLNHPATRKMIQRAAIRHRLPAMYGASSSNDDFMSYSPRGEESYRRVGYFVDRILKGANPGDIPIEQPTRFELTVNLRAAKEIGLTIPPSVLIQADRITR